MHSIKERRAMNKKNILLEVQDLHVYFPVRRGIIFKKVVAEIKAVDGVSFAVAKGETVGLVGESGCGKTTTGRAILKLVESTKGNIKYNGEELSGYSQKEMLPLRHKMQMVFQDPYASLNPRMSVVDIVTSALIEHKLITRNQRQTKATELLEMVGLDPRYMNRFPHEFSGGQRQRIGIARALALNPQLLICDEPIAALDVSIQAQILNLFKDLQEQLSLSYIFITHDLSVVRHVSDHILVMYLGKIVESGDRKMLFKNPLHPYTRVLLSSVPKPDPVYERNRKRIELTGEVPSPLNKPKGCSFSTRCPNALPICSEHVPETVKINESQAVACHLYANG